MKKKSRRILIRRHKRHTKKGAVTVKQHTRQLKKSKKKLNQDPLAKAIIDISQQELEGMDWQSLIIDEMDLKIVLHKLLNPGDLVDIPKWGIYSKHNWGVPYKIADSKKNPNEKPELTRFKRY
jgi:hypothetical protein